MLCLDLKGLTACMHSTKQTQEKRSTGEHQHRRKQTGMLIPNTVACKVSIQNAEVPLACIAGTQVLLWGVASAT